MLRTVMGTFLAHSHHCVDRVERHKQRLEIGVADSAGKVEDEQLGVPSIIRGYI